MRCKGRSQKLVRAIRWCFAAACAATLLAGCGGGASGTQSASSGDTDAQANGALTNGSQASGASPSSFTVQGAAEVQNLGSYKLSVQGLNREFSFYHPANPDHLKLPLVINFHGAGGNVAAEIASDQWVTRARSGKFYYLAPQALSDAYQNYTYWNVGYGLDRDDVNFVKTVLASLVAQQDIDLDRVYVTGMSSGGHMAFYAGQRMQDQIAAVAPISGSIYPGVLPSYYFSHPMPLLKIHGTADTIVKMAGDQDSVSWSAILSIWKKNNLITTGPVTIDLPNLVSSDNSTVTKDEYRGPTIASDIDDYRINGGGHSVPGIEPSANQDINAYDVIWTFFQKHKLSDRR
jgi:polyhydroxybutyrate depolymerase